ncbi:hypothetical protein GV828_12530 [Flavobacterium sp. NST-5]|uniref:Lipid/polyisoprenoid-binding YceI-like domain-containing protein n=1 Tax=Flavobacterium ichthyis TaxID=2698827 RepID=A0ABW9ZD42_9FLAO|nr:YceI family protein [Flavobacterium ichthyis]NBL66026.1 hypothetical protein [Flavobacterium ichthyis]
MQFTSNWNIDPDHSSIEFKVRHLLISNITGNFTIFNGKMRTENDDFETAQMAVSIDVYSFNTNNIERDEHLKSAEFLDADRFPEITIISKKLKKIKGDNYQLFTEMTVKDVTREVIFDVIFGGQAKDGFGRVKAGFELSGVINRKDFNILHDEKNEVGNLVVGEEIKIHANIEFDKEED